MACFDNGTGQYDVISLLSLSVGEQEFWCSKYWYVDGNVAQRSTARLLSCLLGLGVQELVTWCDTVQKDHCLVSWV